MNDRIIYSQDQMMLSLENALDQLKTLQYDSAYRRLLGDDFIERLVRWETDIRQRKHDPFTVVVIGDFKRGKSTLINALLGEEVATSDVTTETVTMNRISYGAHSNEAVLTGGRRARLSDSELRRGELERVLAQLGEPVTRLELKRPCELLKQVTIIDTPGTGDAMQDFSDMVRDSIIQADAVIYVYNIKYPLSQTEQLFLKSAVLPQKYTKLFLVGNFADTLEDQEEYDRTRQMLSERIEGLMPNTEIVMVSALDELCRVMNVQRPSGELRPVLEEQFEHLRAMLEQLIHEKADSVVLDRMQRLTAAMAEDLIQDLDAITAGLDMSRDEAAAALEKLRETKEESVGQQTALLEDIDRQVSSMEQETLGWMSDFLQRIEAETSNLTSAEDIRKYYEFYCIDLLQEALTACVELHQDQLYDQMESVSSQLSQKLTAGLDRKLPYQFRFHLDNRMWTKGDTVGLAMSFLPASSFLGKAASLVADAVSGGMREKEGKNRVPELIQQISGKLTGLSVSITESVSKLYQTLGKQAKGLITDYYAEELANKEHLLNEAAAAAARDDEEKESTRQAAASAKELLNKMVWQEAQ